MQAFHMKSFVTPTVATSFVLKQRNNNVTNRIKYQTKCSVSKNLANRAIGQKLRRRFYSHSRFSLTCRAAADELDDLDFEIPSIDMDLPMLQEEAGATLSEDGIPLTFGNDEVALGAMQTGVVLLDRSHWGRVRVAGEDRISFLHQQTTQDFTSLKPGQGADTVFSSPQGRTSDLATALVQENSVMLITSPSMTEELVAKMDKHIFMADKVTVSNVSARCRMFSLMGPTSRDVLSQLQVGPILDAPEGSHTLLNFQGSPVVLAVGGGLPFISYTLIVDDSAAGEVWSLLTQLGSIPCGEAVWEMARVLCGRPAAGRELTSDFNVLEAGLYKAASLNKGCYLGQETIAKVYNKDAVKQQLWGIELEGAVEVDMTVTNEGKRVGSVTSYSETPGVGTGHFALGYIRCRVNGQQVDVDGMPVMVGDVKGTVTPIPFPTRQFSPSALPQKASTETEKEESNDDAAAAAAEEERKAKKLAAMEAKLAAYMEAQKAAQDKSE